MRKIQRKLAGLLWVMLRCGADVVWDDSDNGERDLVMVPLTWQFANWARYGVAIATAGADEYAPCVLHVSYDWN